MRPNEYDYQSSKKDEERAEIWAVLKEIHYNTTNNSSKKLNVNDVRDFTSAEMRKIYLGRTKMSFVPISEGEQRTITVTEGVCTTLLFDYFKCPFANS